MYTLSLQSDTCQAGVNSCQVGLWSAPLPRARAAEGRGPRTYLRQQITSAETCKDVLLRQSLISAVRPNRNQERKQGTIARPVSVILSQ